MNVTHPPSSQANTCHITLSLLKNNHHLVAETLYVQFTAVAEGQGD